jgi:hypothetical protein
MYAIALPVLPAPGVLRHFAPFAPPHSGGVAAGNRLRADESRREGNELFGRHALLGRFVSCALVLLQVREAHATQDIGGLGELDIRVVNDLYAVAQGSRKSRKGPSSKRTPAAWSALRAATLYRRRQDRMTAIVGRLFATLLERDELVAQIDEGHGVALAAQLEGKESTVERQRLFNVGNLKRDVVETHQAGFPN